MTRHVRWVRWMVALLLPLVAGSISAGERNGRAVRGRVAVQFEKGFPTDLKSIAQHFADVINIGTDEEIKAISANGEDLKLFWSSYAHRGSIDLRAFYDPSTGGFDLFDAHSGMSSCAARITNGQWRLGMCVFNDGY